MAVAYGTEIADAWTAVDTSLNLAAATPNINGGGADLGDNTQPRAEVVEAQFKIVNPKQTIDIIMEDPSDNMVLECAFEAEADYIVSGDNHLLNLREFRDTKIVTATELLKALSS